MRSLLRLLAAAVLAVGVVTFAAPPVQSDSCYYCWWEGDCRYCFDFCGGYCTYVCPNQDGYC